MLIHYVDEFKLNCIFTTGGTGFAPRDVTPEATKNIIHRECPQLALAMALESFKKTQFAALSRAVCGIRGSTLIVNFPGSKKAVVECFQAIQSILPHAIELITDAKSKTVKTHQNLQKDFKFPAPMKVEKVRSLSSPVSGASDISESSSSMEVDEDYFCFEQQFHLFSVYRLLLLKTKLQQEKTKHDRCP